MKRDDAMKKTQLNSLLRLIVCRKIMAEETDGLKPRVPGHQAADEMRIHSERTRRQQYTHTHLSIYL